MRRRALDCLTALAIMAGGAFGMHGAIAGGDDRAAPRGEGDWRDRVAALERRVMALERMARGGGGVDDATEVPDFSGRWLLTLPVGVEYVVALDPRGDGDYRIDAPELTLVHEGLYRVRDDRLDVVEPDDHRLTGFSWTIHNANTLILVEQPELGRIGGNYLGATLTRQVR